MDCFCPGEVGCMDFNGGHDQDRPGLSFMARARIKGVSERVRDDTFDFFDQIEREVNTSGR